MFPILLVNIIAFHFSRGPMFSYNLMYFSLITTDLIVQASSKHNQNEQDSLGIDSSSGHQRFSPSF